MSMNSTKTRDAARGKWREILVHFGVDESYLKNEHGPCPVCNGGKDRFRFDDQDGDGTWYCNGCDPSAGSGMGLLMRFKGWPFDKAAREVDAIIGTVKAQDRKALKTAEDDRRILIKLWQGAKPVTQGDPVWLYLTRRCGDLTGVLEDIRFHPALKHPMGGLHPGMLALLRPNEGKAVGVHRTFLTADGRKADVNPVRMVFGECAPVRMGGVQERLGVAEGIETAICASHAFQVPCWAALNANGLKAWEPPQGVKSVVVFGDNDSSYTGQDAAYHLAHRLALKGLEVQVHIPAHAGTDWADAFVSQEVA